MELDNIILDKFRGKLKTTKDEMSRAIDKLDYYKDAKDAEKEKAVDRIYDKLQI